MRRKTKIFAREDDGIVYYLKVDDENSLNLAWLMRTFPGDRSSHQLSDHSSVEPPSPAEPGGQAACHTDACKQQ